MSPFGFRREAVLGDLHMLDPNTNNEAETTPSTRQLDPAASIVRTAQSLGAAAPTMVRPGELPFDRFTWLTYTDPVVWSVLDIAGNPLR